MQNIICHNERQVKEGKGSKEDVKKGYNLWIDVVNPTEADLFNLQQSFNLDSKAVEMLLNKSKKPLIKVLENQSLTIFLSMKYKSIDNLDTEAVYLFLGSGWLITIHSSEVNLIATVRKMFAERNKRILESPIDALYYYILSNIIEKYEQLLTAIELKVLDFEKESLYQPTRKTLEKLDTLSKQAIVLRRHFWQARHVMNFLIHMEEDKEDVKYLQIVYTVNSTREIYAGSISLQLNDTMRILAVFSTILLPLTFITSIFGMQGFDLHNIHSIPQGFMIILATMMVIVVVLFYMFWKRKWIFVKNKIVKNGNSIDEVHDDKTSSNKTANKERTD